MRFRPRIIPLVLLTLTVCVYADPDAAPPGEPIKPAEAAELPTLSGASFDQLVSQLGHADFARREQATTALMIREDITDKQLAAALKKSDSPEAHQRLIAVAMHYFYRQVQAEPGALAPDFQDEDAALGVSFSRINGEPQSMVVRAHQHPLLEHPAMLISRVYPGFPAFAYLQPGDMIFAINGKFFSDDLGHEEFSDRIRRHKAGDRVTMDVVRGGRSIRLNVQLAQRRRLDDVSKLLGNGTEPSLYMPWRLHLRQLLQNVDEPAPITFDLSADSTPQPVPSAAGASDHESRP